MKRNFRMAFTFAEREYEAHITVVEDHTPNYLTASVADAHLHHLVPESKDALQIVIDEKINTKSGAPEDRLKHAILQAFKEHEKQSPPISLW
jgi:hypothetical protein